MEQSNVDTNISQSNENFYDHLENLRIEKEKYWLDFNEHWDELNALQSPGNTTKKYYKKTKGLQNEYYK